jgi:hypothetical protein
MNSQTYFGKIIVVIFLGLFLVSCGTSMKKGEKWLDSKQNKPEIDVSGTWTSPEWGIAMLKQEGREVVGMLGDYPVKGVVSGWGIYLLMYSGDTVDYVAQLIGDKNTFQGNYSKYYMIDELKGKDRENFVRPMSLTRVSKP